MTRETKIPWLRFEIGESCFVIPLHAVVEVVAAARPRLVPLVPIEFGGVVNVRGEPLPVVDGGILFLGKRTPDPRQMILLQQGQTRAGVLVSYVPRIERTLCSRSAHDEVQEPGFVSWVRERDERLGIVDPEPLIACIRELLTKTRPDQGEKICRSGF